MKTIICKSPEEYREWYDKLTNEGLTETGNSYFGKIFMDRKTREEKVYLDCSSYVKVSESVDNVGRPEEYTEEFFESVYREANKEPL